METEVKKIETKEYYKKIQLIGELVEVSLIREEFFRVDFLDGTFFFAKCAECFVWKKGRTYIITAEKIADEKMYQINEVERGVR